MHGSPSTRTMAACETGPRLALLARVGAIMLSIWYSASCSPPLEFVCTSDEACVLGATQGMCQPTGFCSLPDTECPSGQRYVEHASDELRADCVESELTAAAVNHHRIDLTWLGAVATELFDIEQDGVVIRSGVPGAGFRSMGLDPSTEYVYRVRPSSGDWSLPARATTAAEPEGGYPDQVLADEPRAFWRMEEDATTLISDSTGNIAAGSLEEGADPNVPGKVGSGTFFDGDMAHASLRTVHTAESDWGWTWELWANVAAVLEDDSLLLGCNNTPRWGIRTDGTLDFGMSTRSEFAFIGPETGVHLTFDEWHHLVLTAQGAITDAPVLTMYVDGVLAYRHEDFGAPIDSPWSRGEDGQTPTGDLFLNLRDSVSGVDGTFDEAAAYDYVLSAAQVARHYSAAAGR